MERADTGKLDSVLPMGVSMQRRVGSRGCYFVCDDAETTEDLLEWLDANGVSWQDNSDLTLEEWKLKEEQKRAEEEQRKEERSRRGI